MKKLAIFSKIVMFVLLMVVGVISSVVFVGCGGLGIKEIAKNSISELHLNYFSGGTQNFGVAMWSGLREEPYIEDGIKGDMVQFCVLSIVPNAGFEINGAEFTVEVNKQTYSGVFERSPFDRSYASDLKISLNDTDEIFVYIILNGETEIAKLECISSKFKITSTQAIDLAIQHFTELQDKKWDNGGIEGQCRIISTDRGLGIYFWYICFLDTDKNRVAVIIDPENGEIVADM